MIRQRGKSYEVRVYDPARRKSVYVGSRRTKAEARALEREKEALFSRHKAHDMTIEQFAAVWLDLFPRPRDTTNAHNRERIKQFVADFGARRPDDITRLEARAWAVAHPSRLLAVRAMVNDAIEAGVARENPFAKLGIERGGTKRQLKPDWLTEDEVHHIADGALKLWPGPYGEHARATVLFSAYTGIRPGELYALDVDDIQGDECHVRRQRRPDGSFGPTKNGEHRTVVVPPVAAEAVAAMPLMSDSGALFRTITGRRLSRSNHYPYWQKLAALAGRPGMDYYELRHFGATLLLEMGISEFDVSVQLGHTDGGKLVREVYGHPSHARALARIKGAFAPTSPVGGNTVAK